ncbi:MAG: hypothetical protein B7Z55_18085, partial [Planctomycetales bacterium 12-60-4]
TGWTPHVQFKRSVIEPDHTLRFRYLVSWTRDGEIPTRDVLVYERWAEASGGWRRGVDIESSPVGHSVWLRKPKLLRTFGSPIVRTENRASGRPTSDAPDSLLLGQPSATGEPTWLTYHAEAVPPAVTANPPVETPLAAEPVTCIPGFTGERLPLPRKIMPTALTWNDRGQLVFTSLKGHAYLSTADSGRPDAGEPLKLVREGLSAPFGILAVGKKLLVAHKPEVLLLEDRDGDQTFELSEVVASGWGVTDDYHDWTCGIAGDSLGGYYIGLGSDYAHKNRPKSESRWRGNILRFDLSGRVESIATGLRYPTGLAMLPGNRLVGGAHPTRLPPDAPQASNGPATHAK